MRPKLIASDLDGTFLDSAERVSPRLRDLVTRIDAAGIPLILATGRPARWIEPVVEQLSIRPLCVCANGAVVFDSRTHRILSARTVSSEACRFVASVAHAALPGCGIAAERPDSFVVTPEFVHSWAMDEYTTDDETVVLSEPATKMLIRNPELSSKEMLDALSPYISGDVAHLTFSLDEGLLEVMAPGVTKASGLAEIAAARGVSAEDVVCFGDMPNDIEMLRWAGLGVAMGNARDEVKAAADLVTGSNDEGGVAQVLEQWF